MEIAPPPFIRTMGSGRRARDRIENFRDSQIRKIVEHANANVRFYRRLWDEHGVRPSQVRGYDDLHLLPTVTRAQLQRADADDLIARGTIQNAELKDLVVKVAPAFQAHMLAAANMEKKLASN